MNYPAELHSYYLSKLGEITAPMSGAVALKTDWWNETRLEIPGAGAIIGKIPNVAQWYTVEPNEQRIKEAKGLKVEVVKGKLQNVDFPSGSFNLIVCLGTLNHMGYYSALKTLSGFKSWLRREGKMYLSVWVYSGKSRLVDPETFGERLWHNATEFEQRLSDLFAIEDRDVVWSTTVEYRPGSLIAYRCS